MKAKLMWIAVVMGLAVQPAPADEAAEAAAVVRDAVAAVLGHVRDRDLTPEARREAVVKIIEPLFDFALMGKLALGEQRWSEFTADEKAEFTELFTRRLKDSYLEKIAMFTDGEVTYEPPLKVENKVHVATRIRSAAEEVRVVYKLYKKRDQGWRGYDFEIEGVSMVSSYRSQYAQVLQNGKARDLLDKMRAPSAPRGGTP
jgi:phospholipid transport system substrate-binding protein